MALKVTRGMQTGTEYIVEDNSTYHKWDDLDKLPDAHPFDDAHLKRYREIVDEYERRCRLGNYLPSREEAENVYVAAMRLKMDEDASRNPYLLNRTRRKVNHDLER